MHAQVGVKFYYRGVVRIGDVTEEIHARIPGQWTCHPGPFWDNGKKSGSVQDVPGQLILTHGRSLWHAWPHAHVRGVCAFTLYCSLLHCMPCLVTRWI